MPAITCDFSVPLTVRVDTDTGEVKEVWLHLDSFTSAPRGRFTRTKEDGSTQEVYLRNAFLAEEDDRPGGDGYACDGESKLGDKALALADRVRIAGGVVTVGPEFQLPFTVDDPT